MIQVISAAVVGHDQIRPAVIIEILPGCREAIEQVAVFHSGLPRNIAEGAVAVVVIEPVRCALQASWAAEYLHTLPGALLLRLEHLRQIEIRGHVKVQVAIAVVIGESSASVPLKATGHAGRLRHVRERAIAIVAEEIRLPDV